ncbi:nuclear transport factor 2 family protein [Microbacterium esteraromaticum]|uniref:YybH family protein n=1 Tax=Microbacterium esteraromaticum TaxID=57043 RepID=UPI0023683CC2|nr:nuclear transport factor 2 family protein [Microbacterium esteraromaticum]WDH77782.1 nuclear transport factor 2 family protein [Microbacterium esteraromaticum]
MTNKVTTLDTLNLAFAERFNARDLDGLMALNAPDVVFVPAPGQPVQGEAAVRGALEQFLSLNLPITMTVRHVFQTGEAGLAVADWTIEGTGPDGSQIALSGTTADVAVHDDEHGWRYVIDNPFGTA